MPESESTDFASPLGVDEFISSLQDRWGVSYDIQLVTRDRRLYLQVMWAYLEQQSFPLDAVAYKLHLAKVLDVINRLGLSQEVRNWLANTPKKPRVGRALSLQLKTNQCLDEFVL